MTTRIGRAVLPTTDLDRARAYYAEVLGFGTLFDGALDAGVRLLHVGPPAAEGEDGTGVWLLPAGEPAGERGPALVLYTDELDAVLARHAAWHGAPPVTATDDGAGGRFAHVPDPSGNDLVVVER